jgi:hypothetical protein
MEKFFDVRIDVNATEEHKAVDQASIVHASSLFSSSEKSFFYENHDKHNHGSKNIHTISETDSSIVPLNPITTKPTMQHLIKGKI